MAYADSIRDCTPNLLQLLSALCVIALNILGGIDLAAPIFAILVLRSPCLSVDPFTLG